MWIDLYPLSLGPPGPAFDIKQRKPKKSFFRNSVMISSF